MAGNDVYKLQQEDVTDISKLSINDPIKPQALSMDGDDKTVQCPRCDIWFQKAKRCPECGQMILYSSGNGISYLNQLKKSGLDLEINWKEDMRDRFIELLASLLDGTEYYFEKNKTDSSDYYLELHKIGEKKRLLGFSGKKDKTVRIFFRHYVYEMVNKRYPLPENIYPNKTQEHILVPLSELWNIICVIADKQDCMIKVEK